MQLFSGIVQTYLQEFGGGGGGSLRICFSSKYLANKGTSLRPSSYVSVIQANRSHSSLTVELTHSK